MEKAGNGIEDGIKGELKKQKLREEKRQVDEKERGEQFRGEERVPLVRPREPKLTIADERFILHDTNQEKEPSET